ncbi:hypothetical protein A0J47_005860 [Photobacterium damselae subsp. damselae]|uniref:hypothetical protein n=1 Tax=Photobacterium damselae TaxID=38293 RepID=UPI001495AE94|nr:hypothetical protein [Photobacterium damselae]QSH58012.1 hypothetical protein A0J47_005860 [Photobacterium damselae subsp. damselae]
MGRRNGGNWEFREKKEKKEEKELGIGEEGKEVIKKIGSNGKIRGRKKKKGKLW